MKRIIRITGITLGMALLLLAVACSAEGPTPTRSGQSQPTSVPQPTSAPMMEPVAESDRLYGIGSGPVTAYKRPHGRGLQHHRRLGHR